MFLNNDYSVQISQLKSTKIAIPVGGFPNAEIFISLTY